MIFKNTLLSKKLLLIVAVIFFASGFLFYVEGAVRRVGINNFKVEIDGVPYGGFKEISGIESKTEIIEIQDGSDQAIKKRPGRTKYSNIVLKRGFINDPALADWYRRIQEGVVERKSGSIIVLDRAGGEVMRYNFFEAWPCRWKAPTLDSKGDTEFVEEIELCVERWEQK